MEQPTQKGWSGIDGRDDLDVIIEKSGSENIHTVWISWMYNILFAHLTSPLSKCMYESHVVISISSCAQQHARRSC
jgi:hypothetical protein